MNNERARLLTRPVDSIPPIPTRRAPVAATAPPSPPPVRAPRRARAGPVASARPGRLGRNRAAALALGWPVVLAVSALIEPAPDGTGSAVDAAPAVVSVASVVFLAGVMATIAAAAARRRPSAALWSAGAGSLALGLSLSCPLSGHHAYGAWWFGELAMIAGMLWISVAAWRGERSLADG